MMVIAMVIGILGIIIMVMVTLLSNDNTWLTICYIFVSD